MKNLWIGAVCIAAAGIAGAQDQQVGARAKAMGGSYTAFEDDPISVWLNPAGIATQATQGSVAYQSYVGYPLHQERASGTDAVTTSVGAEASVADPAFLPSYLGGVVQLGSPDQPMAIGLCYVRPYFLRYSFDKVADAGQAVFTPDSEVEQTFNRFRIAFAYDFRFRKAGEAGFFNHLAAGAGVDISFTTWEFQTSGSSNSDKIPAFGAGAGLLLGIYDNTEWLKVNLGIAYQSALRYRFNIEPEVMPAFDVPQQLNVGLTLYLLPGTPLRLTFDFQWLDWSAAAPKPRFAGQNEFRDAINFSVGAEYRIALSESLSLYPRVGFRRFQAPWGDKDRLPMVSNYKMVLDTKGDTFDIFSLGVGFSWATKEGKVRSVEVGADVGGDAFSVAAGYTHEF